MNGIQYFFKCLKEYANFRGRARRSEYWYFVLFNILFSIPFSIADVATGSQILGYIYTLAMIIPSIAVGVRRMHDVGKSGWYLLIPLYSLILACTDGERAHNEYGVDPKNPNQEEFDFDNNQFS